MKLLLENLIKPIVQINKLSDLLLAIPRIFSGMALALFFGAPKFGMPWTPSKSNLSLFEVSNWFVEDVSNFGGLFSTFPLFFAWMAAATEAIGGMMLAFGIKTRLASFLIMSTMLVAIFFQQWDNGLWGMLPALGFLWVSIYSLILGSGRFGIDYLIAKKMENDRLLVTPIEEIKNKKNSKAILSILLFALITYGYAQEKEITLKLNPEGINNIENVYVKGSIAPLSWDKDYKMSDTDGDGIYETTLKFNTRKKYLQFKFVINEETELQGADKRVLWFDNKPITKTYIFNEFEYYSKEELSQFVYTEEQIDEDVNILKEVLQYIHPNIYRFRDSIVMQEDFKKLAIEMKSEPNIVNSFGAISKFTSKIKCSHTFTNLWNQKSHVDKAILHQPDKIPFTFQRIGKRLFLDKNASKNDKLKAGLEILSINNTRTDEILTKLSEYVSSDGSNYEKKLDRLLVTGIEKFLLFDAFYSIEFGASDEFKLKLKDLQSNQVFETSVRAISKTNRTRNLMNRYENINTNVEDLWNFEYIKDDVAKLTIGSFAVFNSKLNWKAYIDDKFSELNKREAKNLIVDIRGNEGGNEEIGLYILTYLLKKPLKIQAQEFSVRYKSIPEKFKKYISTWEKAPYNFKNKIKRSENGRYFLKEKYAISGQTYFPRKNGFKGNSYLITDSSNSSATHIMATYAKLIDGVTLVGQETGGNQLGLNGWYIFFLKLPNTGVEVDIPVVSQYLPTGFTAKDSGIEPTIKIEKNPIDFVNGVDTELNKILELIKTK